MDLKKLTYEIVKDFLPEVGEGTSKGFPTIKSHDDLEVSGDSLWGTVVYNFSTPSGLYYDIVVSYDNNPKYSYKEKPYELGDPTINSATVDFTADGGYEATNRQELFGIMSTISNVLKKEFNRPEVKGKLDTINYIPAAGKGRDSKPGEEYKVGIAQRDKLYLAYIKKAVPVKKVEHGEHNRTTIYLKETLIEESEVNFKAVEKELDEMFDDLDIDINFTKHFKERVLERGLTEEDIIELMGKIHDKYGDEVADLPKDSNRVFTHLTRLVDISSAMGAYGYDGLRDLYLTTAYKRKSKDEPEFRTNATSPKLKVAESYKGKRTNDGAPGTLKAKITKLYGGDVTIEKAKKLKNRKNATAHDKRQANWFINFHSKNENLDEQLIPDSTLKSIANKFKVSVDYIKNQLQQGVEVEKEHTQDLRTALKIAIDHLYEDPKYYIKLRLLNLEENIYPEETSGKAAPYGSGYKKLEELTDQEIKYWAMHADLIKALERNPEDYFELKQQLSGERLEALEYFYNLLASETEPIAETIEEVSSAEKMEEILMPYIISLTGYMVKNGLDIQDAPEIHFQDDPINAAEIFGRTAFYNPGDKAITLFITGRHPKDILRSFAHEMIHYAQDCEGRLHQTYTTDVNEDDALRALEEEAYTRGNMYFRSWENSQDRDLMMESSSKYNVEVQKLTKLIFEYWKSQYTGKEGTYTYSDNEGSLTSKSGDTFYFELDADLKVVETPNRLYGVIEPTGIDPDIDPEEGDPTFLITIQVDPRDLPSKWSDIYFDLLDVVRHEIEHLTHFGPNALQGKKLDSDKFIRSLIKGQVLPKANYFMLPAEVDAMLQGLSLKAKKKREPFAKVVNSYLDLQDLTPEEKESILNIWKQRAKILSLPEL